MNALDLYPVVKDNWAFFLRPDGGYLKNTDANRSILDYGIWDLTPLAVETLLLCDGSRKGRDVLNVIYNSCSADDFSPPESAARFLSKALQKGIIYLKETPDNHRLAIKGSKDKYYPMHFAIELTDACNLRCKHCYRECRPDSENYIPATILINILNKLKEIDVQSLEISGGEPMFHPDFRIILEHALSNFGAVALLTNGTLFDVEVYEIISRYREKILVQVDLDGFNSEEHDFLRGIRGSFDKAATSIQELSERGVKVRVAMTLHSKNYNSVEKIYSLAKSLGATWFTCSPLIDIGRASKEMLPTWDQLKKAMECLNALAEEDPETVLTAAELKRLGQKLGSNCGAGSRSIALGPDGQLRPCFLVNKAIPGFKNIFRIALEDALIDAPLKFFRDLEPPCPELCGGCKYVIFCYGCIMRPFIAWDREKNSNEFRCLWRESTGLKDLMEQERSDL